MIPVSGLRHKYRRRFIVRLTAPSRAKGTVCAGVQIDHSNPEINQARILPGPYVRPSSASARKQPIIAALPSTPQPVRQRLSRRLRDFERNGSPRLLLDNRGTLANGGNVSHITETQLHEIAASEFGIQGDVEHRQIARRAQ